ncbi:phosphopantetheine-binding protein [Streptosporangium algeriense]|uniref:Phosphopantetheine-binding protein n=1 Tax=Streptosporangium algeriense TaxID=1682748 RepID=A0ABW3DPN3_9ACTN
MSLHEKTVERVREIIGDMSPNKVRDPQPDQNLVEDLGYESVSFMELALALEAEFNLFEFDEEQAENMITVGDVSNLIGELVVAAGE